MYVLSESRKGLTSTCTCTCTCTYNTVHVQSCTVHTCDTCSTVATSAAITKPYLALALRNAIRIRVIMPAPVIIGRQLSAPEIMTLA